MKNFKIAHKDVGHDNKTLFIADIAANHDGDLQRAIDLIHMAKEAGADVAKFQHFEARTIVNQVGFERLKSGLSHQKKWKNSVFETYAGASVPTDWTPALKEACDQAEIIFMTTPYSLELVDSLDEFVPAFKIGSGDITWSNMIQHVASKGKPVLLAAGASTLDEVVEAVDILLSEDVNICLMQCNTNYTASLENFKYINLNVLKTFREMYPNIALGLSDHTPGHATVLGAITLGARIIEKHFTDDCSREGPDHKFAMDPQAWRAMVKSSLELENALGVGIKKVEENEKETVVIQRRSICFKENAHLGKVITEDMIEYLRPCPVDAVSPANLSNIVGKMLSIDKLKGDYLRWSDIN